MNFFSIKEINKAIRSYLNNQALLQKQRRLLFAKRRSRAQWLRKKLVKNARR